MTKFKLGQRVLARWYWYKSKGGSTTRWIKSPAIKIGIVIGKRNVAEGHTEYYDDYNKFEPTRHLSLYLVATNLTTAYHVAEEDMEAL